MLEILCSDFFLGFSCNSEGVSKRKEIEREIKLLIMIEKTQIRIVKKIIPKTML